MNMLQLEADVQQLARKLDLLLSLEYAREYAAMLRQSYPAAEVTVVPSEHLQQGHTSHLIMIHYKDKDAALWVYSPGEVHFQNPTNRTVVPVMPPPGVPSERTSIRSELLKVVSKYFAE